MAGLYDLEETIGEGHYAVVKLAKHVFTGEKVAVKVRNNLWCNIISKWWYWDRITEHKYLVFTIRFISVFGFLKSMNEHTILNKKKLIKIILCFLFIYLFLMNDIDVLLIIIVFDLFYKSFCRKKAIKSFWNILLLRYKYYT